MSESQRAQSATKTTITAKRSTGANYLMNILSFGAVCIGGMALFIAMILSRCGISVAFISTLQKIANCIGWLVLCVLSTKFIIKRKRIWLWLVWIIAVIMIVTSIILI